MLGSTTAKPNFAKIHFYMAGRVQEPAGLQWENVDLKRRLLIVSDVSVCWIGTGASGESQTLGSKNYVVTNNQNSAGGSFRINARTLVEAKTTPVTVASVNTGNVVQLQVNVAANPSLTA